MTRNDVLRSNLEHIRRVGELLTDVSHLLTKRAVNHDASKFSEAEWPLYEDATPRLAEAKFGTEEYKENLRAIAPAVEHHQKNNSHHPEFYANGIKDMNLLDLLEMLADWKAAGERPGGSRDLLASINYGRTRFAMSDDMYNLLVNSAIALGWIQVGATNLEVPRQTGDRGFGG